MAQTEIESGYVHYHIEQWQMGKKHLLRESVTQRQGS